MMTRRLPLTSPFKICLTIGLTAVTLACNSYGYIEPGLAAAAGDHDTQTDSDTNLAADTDLRTDTDIPNTDSDTHLGADADLPTDTDIPGADSDTGLAGDTDLPTDTDNPVEVCSAAGVLQLSGKSESELNATQLLALQQLAAKADLVKARFWDGTLYSLILRRPSCLAPDTNLQLDDTQDTLANVKALLTLLQPALGFDATNDLSNLSVRRDEAVTSALGTHYRRIELAQRYANAPVDGGVVLAFIDAHLASIDGPVLVRQPIANPDAPFPVPGPVTYPTWPTSTGMVAGEVVVGRAADLTPGATLQVEHVATRVYAQDSSTYLLAEPGYLRIYNAGVKEGGTLGFTTRSCPTCFDDAPPATPSPANPAPTASAAYREQAAYIATRQAAALRDHGASLFAPDTLAPVLVVTGCTFGDGSSAKFMPKYFAPNVQSLCGGTLPTTIDGLAAEAYPVIVLQSLDTDTTVHEYGHLVDEFYSGMGHGMVQRDAKCPAGTPITQNSEALARLYEALGRNVAWGTAIFPTTASAPTDPQAHTDAASLLTHPFNNSCAGVNRYDLARPGQQVIRELATNTNAAPAAAWSTTQGALADPESARLAVLEAYFFAAKFMHSDASMPQLFDRIEQYYRVYHGDDAARYVSAVIAHHALD